jgi:hypothetical protein
MAEMAMVPPGTLIMGPPVDGAAAVAAVASVADVAKIAVEGLLLCGVDIVNTGGVPLLAAVTPPIVLVPVPVRR